MPEYAVVWTDSWLPQRRFHGTLSIAGGAAHLRGTDGEQTLHHGLSGEATITYRASRDERIDGYPSLRISLPDGRSFRVGSLLGVGVILEIIDALAELA
jgi:hypothetical protein